MCGVLAGLLGVGKYPQRHEDPISFVKDEALSKPDATAHAGLFRQLPLISIQIRQQLVDHLSGYDRAVM